MRILVIRRDNIGDLVCATPLLAALRQRHPEAHIAALVNSYNAGVLAGNPDVDAVHAYIKLKHRGKGESWLGTVFHRFGLLRQLRRQGFDHVILAKSSFDRHGLALAKRVRPRDIIGFRPGERADETLHEVEVMMQLAAPLGVNGKAGPLKVFAAPERVARWRARFPALDAGRTVAVHISAREPGRVWAAEKFVSLIRNLNTPVALLWSPGPADDPRHPGDDARAAAIATQCGAGVTLVPAKTESLEDLAAVLSLCRAFIGADGGAMHLAAGLGLPIVALFENLPYKKRHWYPWQVPYEMVCPETRDIADIGVAQVADAWRRLSARIT
jgi:ADP-heptose:LPS heptosyltransferase